MKPVRIVLDTNVVFSALYSDMGASHQLVMMLGTGKFQPCVSVPIVLEYEATLLGHLDDLPQTRTEIEDVVDYVCAASAHVEVFYLWRPHLRDPDDDMFLEAAVAGDATAIVTHNKRDFGGVDQFGIEALSPGEFLRRTRGKE